MSKKKEKTLKEIISENPIHLILIIMLFATAIVTSSDIFPIPIKIIIVIATFIVVFAWTGYVISKIIGTIKEFFS